MLVDFGGRVDPELNRRVRALLYVLEERSLPGITEYIPSYSSLLIEYDPLVIAAEDLRRAVKESVGTLSGVMLPPSRKVDLPVVYGGEFGPDLADVAAYHGMTEEEVIRLHSSVRYVVYCLGFSPGYPYMGGLPPELHTPRLKEPRLRVPAGAVGIGGEQTGVYPTESPGGWRLLGRTPVPLYQPDRDPPVLLRPGDLVRFVPVTVEEYCEIVEKVKRGEYRPVIVEGEDRP